MYSLAWMCICCAAFKFRKYTSKSDVWSFGVTLWEIFSFGQTPYTGMSPVQVVQALESGTLLRTPTFWMWEPGTEAIPRPCVGPGYRLARPEFCPLKLYEEVICQCLNMEPDARPTFNELFKRLDELYPNGQISDEELAELRLACRFRVSCRLIDGVSRHRAPSLQGIARGELVLGAVYSGHLCRRRE